MNRLDAIRDLRAGHPIFNHFEGLYTNFMVVITGLDVYILDEKLIKRNYRFRITPYQLLSYIRRNYPKHEKRTIIPQAA